jgi:hypothetical protein
MKSVVFCFFKFILFLNCWPGGGASKATTKAPQLQHRSRRQPGTLGHEACSKAETQLLACNQDPTIVEEPQPAYDSSTLHFEGQELADCCSQSCDPTNRQSCPWTPAFIVEHQLYTWPLVRLGPAPSITRSSSKYQEV